ncbi:hypothetical protein [Burkholderia cenocepacia]|uniref:hypothetical protein n=1 Tax=Burkholderia cenocepacia TaxID=95486 RepID=UPI000760F6D3|nr:hypothetical protein [Burkholderia cenocepacia]KWU17894.1 hypothetical protein AS149_14560 [Burkholderia cenocepacia]
MTTVHQQIIKGTSAFGEVLKGAIQRRSGREKALDAPVLPHASRPAYIARGVAPELAVPALVARSVEPVRQPLPFMLVPAVISPLTSVDTVVQAARSKALLDAYAREIETYPETPLW